MLAIVIVDDLQWDDVNTENVSMSKQVISGDTHTQGHYDVIQNYHLPDNKWHVPLRHNCRYFRARSFHTATLRHVCKVVGLKIASTLEALRRRHN